MVPNALDLNVMHFISWFQPHLNMEITCKSPFTNNWMFKVTTTASMTEGHQSGTEVLENPPTLTGETYHTWYLPSNVSSLPRRLAETSCRAVPCGKRTRNTHDTKQYFERVRPWGQAYREARDGQQDCVGNVYWSITPKICSRSQSNSIACFILRLAIIT